MHGTRHRLDARHFALSRVVPCDWCGVQSVDGNHRSLSECVDALRREVDALRRQLEAQERAKDAATRDKPDAREGKLPWKTRGR